MSDAPHELIACDWSGALDAGAQRRAIACARCDASGEGLAVRRGRTRDEVESELAELGRSAAPVVAGLDFSFSLPAWFLHQHACMDAGALWALASASGEHWLQQPNAHFWGRRAGSRQPEGHRAPAWLGYRQCELAAARLADRLPASTFQVGGAGAPGTASVRGWPMLGRLRRAGWSVWPFDAPRLPLLVEIYPRLLTGPVIKSSAAARAEFLAREPYAGIAAPVRAEAAASEDAFDAVVSVIAMQRHADSFLRLRQASDVVTRREGAIWTPAAAPPGPALPLH